jgi:hypothetical protein
VHTLKETLPSSLIPCASVGYMASALPGWHSAPDPPPSSSPLIANRIWVVNSVEYISDVIASLTDTQKRVNLLRPVFLVALSTFFQRRRHCLLLFTFSSLAITDQRFGPCLLTSCLS